MTDTQEAMREFDFDKWWDEVAVSFAKQFAENVKPGSPVHVQISAFSYQIAQAAVKAATAQSAEKIANLGECDECGTPYSYDPTDGGTICVKCLREKIARLEAELDNCENDVDEIADHNIELQTKLAAAELSNRQLRELRYELMGIAADVDAGKGFDVVCRKTLQRVMDALAQPISTEALDAYVNEEIKRRQDAAKRFNGCLPQFNGDTMHPPTSELAPINQDEPYHE